jgi:hypothetical protein
MALHVWSHVLSEPLASRHGQLSRLWDLAWGTMWLMQFFEVSVLLMSACACLVLKSC